MQRVQWNVARVRERRQLVTGLALQEAGDGGVRAGLAQVLHVTARGQAGDWWGSRGPKKEAKQLAKDLGL